MELEPDNGRSLFNNESGQIDVPLEDFHGVPHAGEQPHDTLLPHAYDVGMKPTGGAGYVPAKATQGD